MRFLHNKIRFTRLLLSGKEAEYYIEEDDEYSVSIVNANPMNIIMRMKVNVSSRMYDLTRAKSTCSTLDGSCRLKLLFPSTCYIVLTTPSNVRPCQFCSCNSLPMSIFGSSDSY